VNKREKIHALSLAKECYSMKLDLLTNATVVGDAMRFLSEYSTNNNKKLISKNLNNGDSEEPDYDEKDSSDKRGEEKQEEETGEIMTEITTNQVF
jgi:hypothetical protein